jgi:hypothetical protein
MGEGAYPGEGADTAQIIRLASEYREAAHSLLARKLNGLSLAPCRLVAVHAIELYLNVFLREAGVHAAEIRGFQHDLSKRVERAKKSGLVLRKRTQQHLEQMTCAREYVVTRYGPEMTNTLSQVNRLMATLDELDKRISSLVRPKRGDGSTSKI